MTLYSATPNGLVLMSPEDEALYKAEAEEWETTGKIKRRSNWIRQERNSLLAATDWTQAADVPQAVKDKYAMYRQALRDVPQQPGFPDNITWPTKPE